MSRYFLFFLLGIICTLSVFATLVQKKDPPNIVICPDNCSEFFVGIENPVSIIAQGDNVISLDQIQVKNGIIRRESGVFYIVPATQGLVVVSIQIKGDIVEKSFRAHPIPVVPRLGGKYKDGAFLGNGVFKVQMGMVALVECCGFDARCDVTSYSMIRISKNGALEHVRNLGSRFEVATLDIIQRAQSGDTYIFYDIRADCPGDNQNRILSTIRISIE